MKNFLKRVFSPIVISVIIGSICGRIVYKIYKEDIEGNFRADKIYLLQSGAYKTYDNMKEDNVNNNYLYYIDNNMYKSVIGITKNYNNVDKIKRIYSSDLVVKEYYISDDKVITKQEEFDNMLLEEDEVDKERDIINNIINLYKNNDNTKLIEVK